MISVSVVLKVRMIFCLRLTDSGLGHCGLDAAELVRRILQQNLLLLVDSAAGLWELVGEVVN